MKACYIHIPFCNSICSYCDFCKMLSFDSFINDYLEALEKEIKEIYQGEVLETIYIGGGTPSCLSLEQLKRLFNTLSILKKDKNVEYTIEGNFDSTTKEKLELYKEVGINRLSFGLESTHKNHLEFLKRKNNEKQIEEVLDTCKNLGLNNINIDLIYALPKESIKDLEEDIDYILKLDIPHISTYSLIIEPNTILRLNRTSNIDEELDYEMYQLICKKMKDHHYNHYEISNFSKTGYESRHNTTYWNNEEYYGFGLGASSYIGNKRIENTRSLTEYKKGNRIKNTEELSLKDKIEYEVILNLRKKEGISLIDFKKKYQKELKDCYNYKELVEKNLLECMDNHLFITEEKWYISNEIIVQLLEREL